VQGQGAIDRTFLLHTFVVNEDLFRVVLGGVWGPVRNSMCGPHLKICPPESNKFNIVAPRCMFIKECIILRLR
jgi:hypothetical protein